MLNKLEIDDDSESSCSSCSGSESESDGEEIKMSDESSTQLSVLASSL